MAETITQAQSGAVPLNEDMYTKKGVDELIAQTVKGGITPKGSVAFDSLPTPAATNVGWMYNVTDAFTTTASFVEGAGKKFPAGTNVYVCNPSGSTYKFDVLPGEGPQPGTSAPAADGTAAAGTSAKFAREDHVHPTDKTRAAAADLTSHTGNTTVHVTATERSTWNAKASTDVATATADGLMSASDKEKLDKVRVFKEVYGDNNTYAYFNGNGIEELWFEGSGAVSTAITTQSGSGMPNLAKVTISVTDATTSQKGVVQLSDSTSSNVSTTAATSKAVKSAYDRGSEGVTAAATAQSTANTASTNASAALTRLSAIEGAAATLLTNLSNAALADASMTNANTIKTAVLSLIDFLKQFAATSDNDASTTHTPA